MNGVPVYVLATSVRDLRSRPGDENREIDAATKTSWLYPARCLENDYIYSDEIFVDANLGLCRCRAAGHEFRFGPLASSFNFLDEGCRSLLAERWSTNLQEFHHAPPQSYMEGHMFRHAITHFTVAALAAVALASCSGRSSVAPDGIAAPVAGQNVAASAVSRPFAAASRDTVSVHWLSNMAVVPGSSSDLVRNDNGVTGTVHTDGLTAGNAYTMWFVVFNNPGACVGGCGPDDLSRPAVQASVMFGAGHVVGGEGNNFAGWRGVGDTEGVISGPGLLNPRGAEIHLVVRNHGPAIPGLIDEQIHSFNGGCPPNSCANVQAAAHQP